MSNIDLQLPTLPYPPDALQPFITAETFDYHYGKHHAAYVSNLQNLIKDTPLVEFPLEDIITGSFRNNHYAVFNNSAQHFNHTFFWNCLSPNGGGEPSGDIQQLINRDFGNFENFKQSFSTEAVKLFGAGWAWLAKDQDGKLEILPLKDANTPLTSGKTPILTIDVWEHAYYIDYRNARNKFIEGFWEIVNWDFCNLNLQP